MSEEAPRPLTRREIRARERAAERAAAEAAARGGGAPEEAAPQTAAPEGAAPENAAHDTAHNTTLDPAGGAPSSPVEAVPSADGKATAGSADAKGSASVNESDDVPTRTSLAQRMAQAPDELASPGPLTRRQLRMQERRAEAAQSMEHEVAKVTSIANADDAAWIDPDASISAVSAAPATSAPSAPSAPDAPSAPSSGNLGAVAPSDQRESAAAAVLPDTADNAQEVSPLPPPPPPVDVQPVSAYGVEAGSSAVTSTPASMPETGEIITSDHAYFTDEHATESASVTDGEQDAEELAPPRWHRVSVIGEEERAAGSVPPGDDSPLREADPEGAAGAASSDAEKTEEGSASRRGRRSADGKSARTGGASGWAAAALFIVAALVIGLIIGALWINYSNHGGEQVNSLGPAAHQVAWTVREILN